LQTKAINSSFAKQECLYTVEITLVKDKPLETGDKITGLHGNKGVITRIIPEEDMPYDLSGKPIDLVCSNISVYGRLNYGQISESRIGGFSFDALN
jgi:DNA-directed RNA polymerase subunit beta